MSNHTATSDVMYHYSPGAGERVESIMRLGLLPRDPATGASLAEADGYEPGVYLFADRWQAASLDDGDVWAVDVAGLELVADPFHSGDAFYVRTPVAPQRLRHLGAI